MSFAVVVSILVACSAHGGGSGHYGAQADCDGLHDSCFGGGVCCAGMECGLGDCCVSAGQACDHDGECCSFQCKNGFCTRSTAGFACATTAQCGVGLECERTIGECKVAPGGYCRNETDCVTNRCAGGTCVCGQPDDFCTGDRDCCGGERCVAAGYCQASP